MSNLYLFAQNAIQQEGDSGTTPFTFQVARVGDTTSELTVDYMVNSPVLTAVVDGLLPVDESDFGGTFPTGTVTFAAGEALQTITVDVAGDEAPEFEQSGTQNADLFEVALSNPSDGASTIATESATGIILNDDAYFGAQNSISESAPGASSVTTADLDGDGDNDVLSTSSTDGSITWYENANGDGTTWNPNVVATDATISDIVFASDVDADGDSDILAASTTTGELLWYENQDGSGTFSAANTALSGFTGANSIVSADVDGDTDADLLVAGNDTLTWYENLAVVPDVVDPTDPVPGQPQPPVDPPSVPGEPSVPGQPGDDGVDPGVDNGGSTDPIGEPVPGQPSVPDLPVDGVDPGVGNGGQPDDIIGTPGAGQPSVGQADDLTNPNGAGVDPILGDPIPGGPSSGVVNNTDVLQPTPDVLVTDPSGISSPNSTNGNGLDSFGDPVLGQPSTGTNGLDPVQGGLAPAMAGTTFL